MGSSALPPGPEEEDICCRILSRFTVFLAGSSAGAKTCDDFTEYLDSIRSKKDESRSFLMKVSMEDSLMCARETLSDWFGWMKELE